MGPKGRRVLVGLAMLLVAGVFGAPAAQAYPTGVKQAAPSGDVDATGRRDIQLILDYRVAHDCPVYPNYPKDGVIGKDISWKVTSGDIVGWRYNVNDT
jgi:hypothetical protein